MFFFHDRPPVEEEAMSLEEHNGVSNGVTSTNNKDGASLITCNSTVLVREKLPLQATNGMRWLATPSC